MSVLCLTMLVNGLLNAFANCVGEVTVFSLKVIVCCVCDPSVCLGDPSICLICVFVLGMLFNSQIEGSLMLFMCSILCLMSSGSS